MESKEALNTNVSIKDVQLNSYWNSDDDIIFKEWVDKSSCLHWLHERSYKRYKRQYLRQMIPVIIISTLTGAANFAIERLSQSQQKYASLIIGGFNIIAGIISTISQFLKTSELKEGHRIASKSWDKFNRGLKLELQRRPTERTDKKELFTYSLKEFDRLIELSPDIPSAVLYDFRSEYKTMVDLIKPEIADKIASSKVYLTEEDSIQIIQDTLLIDHEQVIKNEFVDKFESKYGRRPTEKEVDEYMDLKSMAMTSSL